jgi:alpha-glucosidase
MQLTKSFPSSTIPVCATALALVLIGEISVHAAFVRRSGQQWFVGVINGSETTVLDFPLDFLGRSKFQKIQLGNAPDRTDAWQREEKVVTRKDSVKLSVRPSGGAVIKLSPSK